MISDIFIARPRLAFVVSVVMVLAGLIALTRIPVAQYPDIVPPQVTVTTTFPGASATTVESSVAEPIEAQVNGVDKAIYMTSTSGNDGSYTLTVSFAVGSDPNIDAVNVQNRVNLAQAQLPAEVNQQGLTIRQRSSAMLQVVEFYSPNQTLGLALPQQLRDDQRSRHDRARARRRPGSVVREPQLQHADLARHRPVDRRSRWSRAT